MTTDGLGEVTNVTRRCQSYDNCSRHEIDGTDVCDKHEEDATCKYCSFGAVSIEFKCTGMELLDDFVWLFLLVLLFIRILFDSFFGSHISAVINVVINLPPCHLLQITRQHVVEVL